ncbi:MAG: PQQ-binding-like beta-propeller repeat protein [Gemmataceae bacterium]
MLISATCPRCRATYQVQDTLRGKAMRCLEPVCRNIFVVGDVPTNPTTPPPARVDQQSGSVGDLVPLVPIENEGPTGPNVGDFLEVLPVEVDEVPPLEVIAPDEGKPAPDWSSPPPVRRPGGSAPVEPVKARVEPPKDDGPQVLEQGDWSAPPVRRQRDSEGRSKPDEVQPARDPDRRGRRKRDTDYAREPAEKPRSESDVDLSHRPPSRWATWVVVPLLLFTFGALGFGGFMIWKATRETEEKLAREADEFYTQGQFPAAENHYEKLLGRFGDGDQAGFYTFRKELAGLRRRMAEPPEDLREVLDHAAQVLKERAKDPLLPAHGAGLAESLIKMLTGHVERAQAELKDDTPLALLEHARPVIEATRRIKLPADTPAPGWDKLEESFNGLRQAVARLKEKNAIFDRLKKLAGAKPSYATLLAVQKYLAEIRPGFADVADSAEAKKLVDGVREAHLASVRFVEQSADPPRVGDTSLDEPSVLIDPVLRKAPLLPDREEVPALALVRGLLYALDRATGQVRWALRVGVDTSILPLQLTRRAGVDDAILVLSSDTNTLSAVRLDGSTLWRYRLPAPVLGRPVVVERRAYLATYSGEVHEIELIKGKRLGSYDLGQRLTLGGSVEPGSTRVYFPADDGCVYVVDVAKRRCEMILYSGHPAGSLRSEPILIPPIRDETPGYLVLNQAADLDSIRLRVFDLPLRESQAEERKIQPAPTMRGWSWFAPYSDPEKLLLLSDAGRLGLFGIRQPNNRDQALFPLLPTGSLDLAELLQAGSPRRGRSEVVHVEGDDVWVLAANRMQRLRLGWGPSLGPRVVPVWEQAVEVGSPVHASQVFENATGKKFILSVTQPPGRSCVQAQCVADETGAVLWQRQLGLVARGELIAVRPGDGEPLWLAQDQAGAVLALDPTRYLPRQGMAWLSDGRSSLVVGAAEENLEQPPALVPAADGKSAYALAFPGDGRELVISHITADPDGARKMVARETRVRLTEPLAGRPMLVGDQLLLPLADGALNRLVLPVTAPNPSPEGGPNWRADRAPQDARGLVAGLGADRFVTSDGVRGLMSWEWAAGSNTWKSLPAGRGDEPTLVLPERISGMIALPGKTPYLAASDIRGNLHLIAVLPNGGLEVRRTWALGGDVGEGLHAYLTPAGPRLGCVVERSKLVWIDPQAKDPLWSYTSPGEDPITGAPTLLGEQLVVADQSGLYVGLDLKGGKPVGNGYQLRGSIAPVSGAVPFQADRLLAPLSDGTLLLLNTARLRQ